MPVSNVTSYGIHGRTGMSDGPIKIPLLPRKKKVGLMYHVQVEETPHPMSVQCSKCMAQRGQLCYDEDNMPEDFMEKLPRLQGGYHEERVQWARELHKRNKGDPRR